MSLSTHTSVTVDLSCDNPLCKQEEKLPQEAVKASQWQLYRKGKADNLFLYEKLEQLNGGRALSTSVRMPTETRATFCSVACAEIVMRQELERFLHKPIVLEGERQKLHVHY